MSNAPDTAHLEEVSRLRAENEELRRLLNARPTNSGAPDDGSDANGVPPVATDAVSGAIGTDLLGRAFLFAAMTDVPKIEKVCKGWKLALTETGDELWRSFAKKHEPQLFEVMKNNKTDVAWRNVLRSRRTLDSPNQSPVPPLQEKLGKEFIFELTLNIGDESFTFIDEDAWNTTCGIIFQPTHGQNEVNRIMDAISKRSRDDTDVHRYLSAVVGIEVLPGERSFRLDGSSIPLTASVMVMNRKTMKMARLNQQAFSSISSIRFTNQTGKKKFTFDSGDSFFKVPSLIRKSEIEDDSDEYLGMLCYEFDIYSHLDISIFTSSGECLSCIIKLITKEDSMLVRRHDEGIVALALENLDWK